MPRVTVSNPAGSVTVFQHGAHVTDWTPAGEAPVLWVSSQSAWNHEKPIRGGVPLCFPWFGPNAEDASAPIHGWARISEWSVATQDASSATLTLQRDGWSLRYIVRVAQELHIELQIQNTSAESRTCSTALHSYFAVGGVKQCSVHGLQGATYVDKMRGGERHTDDGPIEIVGETDRVYFSTSTVEIHDAALGRKLVIEKNGSGATVVWNPWIAKSAAMPDFGDDEWKEMLCVETANALDCSLTIGAGQTHVMSATIRVEKL